MGVCLEREKVFTKNGRGVAVYRLPPPDGRILVEYPFGGGELLHESEVLAVPESKVSILRCEEGAA